MDYEKLINDSKNRIAVDDLQLLERCCDDIDAKIIVEIGSADGGSSVVLGTKAKQRSGHLYCIEMKPKQKMVDNMKDHDLIGHYTIIPKMSPWISPDDIPEKIDLLFIDGNHNTRWALADYHYFEPRVRCGGVIVFHDTGGNCQEDRRQPNYKQDGYICQVQRAIDLIMETDRDKLIEIDRSFAAAGGAIAYKKKI